MCINIPENFERINNLYFQDGFRVIAIASKEINSSLEELISKDRNYFEGQMLFQGYSKYNLFSQTLHFRKSFKARNKVNIASIAKSQD
jgi:HJR/Mrr/RecB family endonuclease